MSRPAVLILDDDASAAEAFKLMLQYHDFDVRLAADVDTGWTELTERPPDALVLDLRLGTADGMEFLRRLRAAPAGAAIPVAMVTGDYLLDDRVTDELCALDARLHFKPLWEEDLVRIVTGLVTAPVRRC
jgi:DNA-binding response OmpR family regulator